MIFAWIEERRGEYPVAVLCRVLGMSRSGYYARANRARSATAVRREELVAQIQVVHADVRGRYGSPRLAVELYARCVNTVAKLMTAHGLRAKGVKRFVRTTDSNHRLPFAENVLGRDFTAARPNEKWAMDITYIPTLEGWLFLALVVDLFSRSIVGWAMAATMTAGWWWTPSTWPWAGEARRRTWCRTRTAGASTPASTTRPNSVGTGR